ncbi:uncharacterized protein PFL1_02654 [Pseudozyma flocculosa PF-1]|uniref:Related to FMP30 - mitochondrial inner membrane protein with a role in maintaining mitochondrial morphology n=2 Tax=Pseudozyma flocculosa TaxID=84751 RepID=A0A5C3F0S5_9BASI|nr:uncharacterized protein PFL1_02654 [Pseudozyma flocculosa PF-1]EPQ29981.1 hypothetical protein PFL1_02654 [Pseudozyma flocculosa PF-1]SPO37297.1 related to FMP30 - mitochondrial inner membrane protein with a role in maintaining mitochondrial morphology [Pseudozyma flocculosa]
MANQKSIRIKDDEANGSPANGDAANGDDSEAQGKATAQPRRSMTASRRDRRSKRSSSKHSPSEPEEKPAFDVLISCRTADPISDAHSRDIDQLPSHWQPTFISNLSRAASQGLGALNPDQQQEEHRRFEETHKPSGSWKRRVFRPAQEQSHTDSLLPRLAFKNPWDSFRAPGIADMLNGGLKWGLPEGYQEGGSHNRVLGNKPSAAKKVRRQQGQGIQHGLDEDWDHVEVREPDWGWPGRFDVAKAAAAPSNDKAGAGDKDDAANGTAEPNGDASKGQPSAGGDSPTSPVSAEAPNDVPEWVDPQNDNVPAARVTWLGHATTLLQLPSLGHEDPDPEPEHEPAHAVEADAQPANGGEADETHKDEADTDAPASDKPDGEPPAKAGNGDVGGDGNSRRHSHGHKQRPRRIPRERIGDRSINILFDPVFSERCSPSQSAGPQRYTPAPCQVDELPPIDIVCISHSHYDHLDYLTMKALRQRRGRKVHAFVGLGLKDKIVEFGWSPEQVSELDWWDSAVLQVHEPQVANVFSNASSTTVATTGVGGDAAEAAAGVVESKLVSKIRQDRAKLRIVCTPAQHGSGRGGDKDQTLWCSWVVEWMSGRHAAQPSTEERIPATFRAFFAGDTGLKYHRDSVEKRHKYPPCPAFEQIATRIGRPDLLLLPISVGSSLSYFRSWDPFPRSISPFPRVSAALTSSIHMDPYDAVETHEIMRGGGAAARDEAKQRGRRLPVSLAVHYGTFVRNAHQTAADVRQLLSACQRSRLAFRRTRDGRFDLSSTKASDGGEDGEKGMFLVSHQGETVWVPFVWEEPWTAPAAAAPPQQPQQQQRQQEQQQQEQQQEQQQHKE